MRLTMLGTGHAVVTECYNTCYVLEGDGDPLLVDGGGGSMLLHQLKHAGIAWPKLHHIFVTHRHLDHIMGIFWMMRLMCSAMRRGRFEGDAFIYSHDEVINILRDTGARLLQPEEAEMIDEHLHLVEVHDGETLEVAGRTMDFFDIGSTKAKQFGYRMHLSDGRTLVCCGDEPCSATGEQYAQGADWMLHEAFCLASQADKYKPYEKHHSTVADACALAERLSVRNLLLYHTEEDNLTKREELYRAEGAPLFSGNLFIPNDLDVIEI